MDVPHCCRSVGKRSQIRVAATNLPQHVVPAVEAPVAAVTPAVAPVAFPADFPADFPAPHLEAAGVLNECVEVIKKNFVEVVVNKSTLYI